MSPQSTDKQHNSNNGHDPKFVYYLLRHYVELVRSIGLGGGSAQPIINKTDFSQLKVVASDIGTQRKIGATLANYDDLIKNNRRRILLLEESARLLYREWFAFQISWSYHVILLVPLFQ